MDKTTKVFEDGVKELLEFHCEHNFPFRQESEAQAYLYKLLFERLEAKGLIFTKEGFLSNPTLVLTRQYSGDKPKFDIGIISPGTKTIDEHGEWILNKDLKYKIVAEIKAPRNSWDNLVKGKGTKLFQSIKKDIEKLNKVNGNIEKLNKVNGKDVECIRYMIILSNGNDEFEPKRHYQLKKNVTLFYAYIKWTKKKPNKPKHYNIVRISPKGKLENILNKSVESYQK